MSQSEDTVPVNFWTYCDLWNNPPTSDVERADSWTSLDTKIPVFGLAKQNDVGVFDRTSNSSAVSMAVESSKYSESSSAISPLLSWAPVGMKSVLNDVDLPSIWANPDTFSSSDQNLCLSGQNVSWPPVSHSASDEAVGTGTSLELWGPTQGPSLFGISGINQHNTSWNLENNRFHSSEANIHVTDPEAAAVTPISDISPKTTSLDASSSAGNAFVDGGSASQNPGVDSDPIPVANLSAEQLLDHLINSNDGWGRRTVDQTTPWDPPDMMKTTESIGRSGIVTPTPGSHSSNGVPAQFRSNFLTQSPESNVWTNEPPTGTAIWEMHYESGSTRSSAWNHSVTSPINPAMFPPSQAVAAPLFLFNSNIAARSTSQQLSTQLPRAGGIQRPSDATEKPWNSTSVTPGTGRPLLGGARNGNVSTDSSGWFSDSVVPVNGYSVDSCHPWSVGCGSSGVLSWSSAVPTCSSVMSTMAFCGVEEMRRQPAVLSHSTVSQNNGGRIPGQPFGDTFRTDILKYLVGQGFKKEDAQAVLIDCNMDPERALQELRDRFGSPFTVVTTASGFQSHSSNALPQFQNANGFVSGGHFNESNLLSIGSTNNLNSMNTSSRNKLSNLLNSNVPISAGTHTPNPQLIRQQLTQQVRSALTQSLPIALSSAVNGGHPAINASGNSLLGQPPPPLLNTTGVITGTGVNASPSVPSFLPIQGRNANTFGNNARFGQSSSTLSRRSDRLAIIQSSIQELQKKHQSIQQQLLMYRNNPTMCSQPQYVDVFTELQGQLQQIDAQLKAKRAQLSLAYAQDYATPNQVQPLPLLTEGYQSINGAITPTGSFSQNRAAQDHLVQQLMDLRLRPAVSTSSDADGDFPVIGTWTAHNKGNQDNQEKASSSEGSGPRSLTGRSNGFRSQNLHNSYNNNGNWQGNNLRSIFPNGSSAGWNNTTHATRPVENLASASSFDSPSCPPIIDNQQSVSGQWLLIQSTVSGTLGSNLNVLHNLLSHYGLTHFHVLNSSPCTIMIRVQSIDHAVQLMRAVGDRLSIEPVNDPDFVAQMHNRLMSHRSESTTLLNTVADTGTSFGLSTPPNWMNADQFITSSNSGSPFGSKKPSHNTSRLGIVASGIH